MRERDRLDQAADAFAARMKAKLRRKHREGFSGWECPAFQHEIRLKLLSHIVQLLAGDTKQAIDVANLAMFLEIMAEKANKLPEPPAGTE